MSVSPTTRRQTWNTTRTEKSKQPPDRSKAKNTAHAHASVQKNEDVLESANAHKTPKAKRWNSIDAHSKSKPSVDATRAHDAPRSRGATFSHDTSSSTKGHVNADAHGKTTVHGKTSTHRATKKSDGHKSQTIKPHKSEQDSPETEDSVITAVSQSFDNMSFEKLNDNGTS